MLNDNSSQDIINIGSYTPASGGVLTGIQGALNIVGNGTDFLNLDDSGSTATLTGTLSGSSLTGLGMGSVGITYSQLGTLNLFLGGGTNTLTVSSTQSGAATSIDMQRTSGPTKITMQGGIAVINIGSQAPGNGGSPQHPRRCHYRR